MFNTHASAGQIKSSQIGGRTRSKGTKAAARPKALKANLRTRGGQSRSMGQS